MRKFVEKVWEDSKEIILHEITSLVVIVSYSFYLFIINQIVSLFHSISQYIEYLELASGATILILFLIHSIKSIVYQIKKR